MLRRIRHGSVADARPEEALRARRDKLRKNVQPVLQPGETVEQVFIAQGGMTPWVANMPLFGALGALVMQSWVSRRIIAVTDRAVVVIQASKFAATSPK